MTDGLVLPPGAGQSIASTGMTVKIDAGASARWSVFEAEVRPGFDVGAHRHGEAEELFYILDGELDLLAFEPAQPTGDWRTWRAAGGRTVVRGGPGSLMHVPAGCPHAFANSGTTTARMLFLVTPSGHEQYLRELADILDGGRPDPAVIADLRARHDIEPLTPMAPG